MSSNRVSRKLRNRARAAVEAGKAVTWDRFAVEVPGEPSKVMMAGPKASGWAMAFRDDGMWIVFHVPSSAGVIELPCPLMAMALVQALAVNAPLPERLVQGAAGDGVFARVSDIVNGLSATFGAQNWPQTALMLVDGLMNGRGISAVAVPADEARALGDGVAGGQVVVNLKGEGTPDAAESGDG